MKRKTNFDSYLEEQLTAMAAGLQRNMKVLVLHPGKSWCDRTF